MTKPLSKKIIALIPAYNEGERIVNTIKSLKKTKYINEIIVIDDGSIDNTASKALATGVKVIKLNKNKGKGYAIMCGLKEIKSYGDIIVFIDADLEHTALEADKLVLPLLYEDYDVTIAKFKPPSKKGGFGLVKFVAKKSVYFFTSIEMDNCLSGQRAFKAEVLNKIKKIPSSYGLEIGMLIDILKLNYKIKEVDVDMVHRETGRDIKGFIHRGKQLYQIVNTLIDKGLEEII